MNSHHRLVYSLETNLKGSSAGSLQFDRPAGLTYKTLKGDKISF